MTQLQLIDLPPVPYRVVPVVAHTRRLRGGEALATADVTAEHVAERAAAYETIRRALWRRPPMLRAGRSGAGVRVGDDPPGLAPFATASWTRIARAVADHIALGHWCDDLALDALAADATYDDRGRLTGGRLAIHKTIHGNRRKR